ncbi:T9SS type A sorting domain-containing protein [Halocola ammonii]
MKKILSIVIALVLTSTVFGQLAFERDDSIEVIKDGEPMLNPWAGGFNSPQFSNFDLFASGNDDLFVFDRIGDRIMLFHNIAEPGETPIYKHRYDELLDIFPELEAWALMRDYNGDGLLDLFTSEQSGVRVYKNIGDFGPFFELASPMLQSTYNFGNPFDASLYCVNIDIPIIEDYDGDGDLDILSFTEGASTIYYFCGQSAQNGDSESLDFDLGNRCWGYVKEGAEDNTIFLGEECSFNVVDPRSSSGGERHTGGTLAFRDLNGDGYGEVIIGDVTFDNLIALENGPGEQTPDSVTAQYTDFPASLAGDVAVDLTKFPAAYFLDLDGDNIDDLVVSPNAQFAVEDDSSAWFYKNTGTNDLPYFELQQKNFLQDGMIDRGTNAYPVLFDYNGDGLKDLLVGNKQYYQDGGNSPSSVALYENTGTTSSPQFTFITDDYADLSHEAHTNLYPAFGDIDGDGDQDLVLGVNSGELLLFTNSAGSGNTADFSGGATPLQYAGGEAIDVGVAATPQFFDVDGDGILDLLVGEKNGNINYIKNNGTAQAASFELIEETLGGVIASNELGINGYSVPHMFLQSGQRKLLVGTEVGIINFYDNINGNLDGEFNLVEEQLADIKEGDDCAVWLEDINNDGWPDLFYGQIGGGVAFYAGIDPMISVGENTIGEDDVTIYPNPASDRITVRFEKGNSIPKRIVLKNMLGQEVLPVVNSTEKEIHIETHELPRGVYVIVITTANGSRSSKKLVIE